MKISLILPFLDEAASLPATLANLASARAAPNDFEVIAVDGGSQDESVSILDRHRDIRILRVPPGRAAQMNAGAAVATGDILLFLHADSWLPVDAVAAITTALSAGARWGRFDVTIAGKPLILRVIASMMNVRSRLTGIATGDQGIFVTRDAFNEVGGFPPIALMEDIALSKALKRLAGPPACLRQRIVTSGRRWEHRGPWRTIVTMWRVRLAYALGADPERLARIYS